MLTKTILRSDLQKRAALCSTHSIAVRDMVSFRFVRYLLCELETAGENVDAVCGAFFNAPRFSGLSLKEIRLELSRLPVWGRFQMFLGTTSNGIISLTAMLWVLQRAARF